MKVKDFEMRWKEKWENQKGKIVLLISNYHLGGTYDLLGPYSSLEEAKKDVKDRNGHFIILRIEGAYLPHRES